MCLYQPLNCNFASIDGFARAYATVIAAMFFPSSREKLHLEIKLRWLNHLKGWIEDGRAILLLQTTSLVTRWFSSFQ
jgi:hypothetical protein